MKHLQGKNHSRKESGKRFGLYALAFLTFVYIGRFHEMHPLLWNLHLVKVSFLLSILAIIFAWPKNTIARISKEMPGSGILLLYVLAFISIFGSIWPSASLGQFKETGYKVLYFFIFTMIVTSEDRLNFMIKAVELMYTAMVIIALLSSTGINERLSITAYYDPNDFALFLTICLPFLFSKVLEQGPTKISSTWKGFLHILGFVVIILTGSRGGFVAFLICTFLVIKNLGLRTSIKIYTVPTIILLVAFTYIFYSEQFARISGIVNLEEDYNVTSERGRLAIWKRGTQLLIENPIFGTGIGTYATADGTLIPSGRWITAHNSFLQIGVELGIPAMFIFIMILKSSYKKMRKINKSNISISIAAKEVNIAIIAYIAGGMLLSWAYAHILFLILGLSSALANLCRNCK